MVGPPAGTFSVAALRSTYDTGLKLDNAYGDADSYCLDITVGGQQAKVVGPGGTVTTGGVCTNANG